MITICVGLWDNRSSLSFCSTSGGLPKLAQLQLGEGGEAGTERPNFLRANIFFRGHITVQLSLSLAPRLSHSHLLRLHQEQFTYSFVLSLRPIDLSLSRNFPRISKERPAVWLDQHLLYILAWRDEDYEAD